MFGIDLSDLGLDHVRSGAKTAPTAPADAPARPAGHKPLVQDSPLAKVLFHTWSGTPIVLVDSPPGAGKTTLVAHVVSQLSSRSGIKIVVACPTRRGASDIAERIGAELGLDSLGRPQISLGVKGMPLPPNVGGHGATVVQSAPNAPVVKTVASCKMSPPPCDLMVIDEAAQVTFADAAAAADQADQILLVGDPGQIGPVVTADMSPFEGLSVNPSVGAPEVFRLSDAVEILSLGTTYRLGQETVDVIAPLYSFPFDSSRPDRYVADPDGARLPEIVPCQLPLAPTFDDLDTMVAVADQAVAYVGSEVVEEQPDGSYTSRKLKARDVAVVVAHNAQVSKIEAILASRGASGVKVGTADSMQGGQWHAVVALDPLIGYSAASPHQLSPGRLCVMASRHMTSLTWCFDEGWVDALTDPEIDQHDAALGRKVRRALTGAS